MKQRREANVVADRHADARERRLGRDDARARERRGRLAVALGRASRDVDVEQMDLVVVRGDAAVGADEQRARRRALAAVGIPAPNRNRAADDPQRRALGRLGEKPLRRAVAERARSPRRDRRRSRRGTKNSPATRRASRLAARPRRRAAPLREDWPARRACSSSALPLLSSLRPPRVSVARRSAAAPRTTRLPRAARSVSRSTIGSCQLPVTQYDARPMPPSGFLKMRVKISSAAATCGPASSAPTVGSTLPGSAVTTACWR